MEKDNNKVIDILKRIETKKVSLGYGNIVISAEDYTALTDSVNKALELLQDTRSTLDKQQEFKTAIEHRTRVITGQEILSFIETPEVHIEDTDTLEFDENGEVLPPSTQDIVKFIEDYIKDSDEYLNKYRGANHE